NRCVPLFCKLFSVATLSIFLSKIISFRLRLLSLLPWAQPLSLRHLRQHQLSGVSPHIWSDRAGVHPRLARRAFRARCDSARRANPSPFRRARARSSAPANYAPRPECRQSLPDHSSTALLPLCAKRSSASSACASSLARTHRGAADNRPAPAISISPTLSVVLCESID